VEKEKARFEEIAKKKPKRGNKETSFKIQGQPTKAKEEEIEGKRTLFGTQGGKKKKWSGRLFITMGETRGGSGKPKHEKGGEAGVQGSHRRKMGFVR